MGDAFDSLLWAMPTSTTRGKSKRGIHRSVDKYICIGACAARGHKGVNCVQSGLQKVPIRFQKVIKTFVSESEDLYFMWLSSLNISRTKEGLALCNVPTFTLPGIPDWCAKIQGSLALGINVALNTHLDNDWTSSLASVHTQGVPSYSLSDEYLHVNHAYGTDDYCRGGGCSGTHSIKMTNTSSSQLMKPQSPRKCCVPIQSLWRRQFPLVPDCNSLPATTIVHQHNQFDHILFVIY